MLNGYSEIDLLSPSFNKQPSERKGPFRWIKTRQRGKTSLCFLVKTNSQGVLCPRLNAEPLGVKGVEKRVHSWLTAETPALLGVKAPGRDGCSESYLLQRLGVLRWRNMLKKTWVSPAVQAERKHMQHLSAQTARKCCYMGTHHGSIAKGLENKSISYAKITSLEMPL